MYNIISRIGIHGVWASNWSLIPFNEDLFQPYRRQLSSHQSKTISQKEPSYQTVFRYVKSISNSFPKQLADMFLTVNYLICFKFFKRLTNSRNPSLSADINIKKLLVCLSLTASARFMKLFHSIIRISWKLIRLKKVVICSLKHIVFHSH